MADILLKTRVTANGSGVATATLGRAGFNGLVTEVYVKPVGSVDGGGVATVTLVGGTGATKKTSTSVASAVFLLQMPDDHFVISEQERLTVNISSAAENDAFDVSAKVIPLS